MSVKTQQPEPTSPLNSASSGMSRRSFLRVASAAAATVPILTEAHLAWAARAGAQAAQGQTGGGQNAVGQASRFHGGLRREIPSDAVLIDANENPLGPCTAACEAVTAAGHQGGRYAPARTEKLTAAIAEREGLKPEYIAVYAGSSEPLHYTVMAFTGPGRPYVTADPGYEAGMRAADTAGAQTLKVPLTTSTYAHDVRAMVTASPNAGVLYICTPNNPTGTATPKEEIQWALAHKPKGSILLIDEAYIHFTDNPSCMDMVQANEDVIVLRTFSKLYGMAGLRCGFAAGRPDLLAKLQTYGTNAMPVTAVAAASASLEDASLIPTRRKIMADTRNETFAWLQAKGYRFTPSESNCFMVDGRRDGRQTITAMQEQHVYIGRIWPAWPTWVRITVGTPEEMARFRTAWEQVMATPVEKAALTAEPWSRIPQSQLS
jgi:histidinol-phosphate aminotransferase